MSDVVSIEEYLAVMEVKLRYLPKKEQQQHLNEIKDELLSLKEEMVSDVGYKVESAEQKALESFVAVDTLAKEIVDQYNKEQNDYFSGKNIGFVFITGSLLSGSAVLAFPIYYGGIDGSLAGTLGAHSLKLLIALSFLFLYFPTRFNAERMKIFRFARIGIIGILVIPIGAFFLSTFQSDGVPLFSFYYLIGYLIGWSILYYAITRLYKRAWITVAMNG
ncbi:hypothetical protein ACERII_13390 [Evansella sp. AB-rgal1]|uniref:hypothetical protein n=1 Tax=Evansella sp. AB-rgal1 TaxID=3242696 RepID=UPI00359EA7A2